MMTNEIQELCRTVSDSNLSVEERLEAGETLWLIIEMAHKGLNVLKRDLRQKTQSHIRCGESKSFPTSGGVFRVSVPKPTPVLKPDVCLDDLEGFEDYVRVTLRQLSKLKLKEIEHLVDWRVNKSRIQFKRK